MNLYSVVIVTGEQAGRLGTLSVLPVKNIMFGLLSDF
jgi:hypothetical protein